MTDFHGLVSPLSALAAEAGNLILSLSAGGLEIRSKEDASPVTNADVRAEEMLLAGLAILLPGIPILAEESVSCGKIPKIGDTFLVIDPLDGTREFVGGRPEYTVNIGIVSGGVPVLGILHAPALGRTYRGVPGRGAARAIHRPGAIPNDSLYAPIATRKPGPALTALTSRGYNDSETEAFLDELGVKERQRLGSAYKFALVAEGSADVYPRFGPTMEWDLAAGHALIVAAGGTVRTPAGGVVEYGKADTGFRNGAFVAWGREPS